MLVAEPADCWRSLFTQTVTAAPSPNASPSSRRAPASYHPGLMGMKFPQCFRSIFPSFSKKILMSCEVRGFVSVLFSST